MYSVSSVVKAVAVAVSFGASQLRTSFLVECRLPTADFGFPSDRFDLLDSTHRRVDNMSVLDWSQCAAVESVPERVHGAWVFRGTRIPVALVFANLEAGMTVDELLQTFQGLTREQIAAVLHFAARSLETPVSAS